jgi:hypothetical protein
MLHQLLAKRGGVSYNVPLDLIIIIPNRDIISTQFISFTHPFFFC